MFNLQTIQSESHLKLWELNIKHKFGKLTISFFFSFAGCHGKKTPCFQGLKPLINQQQLNQYSNVFWSVRTVNLAQ